MKKQNRDQKRKQFKYGINKNKKKKLVDPDALNDKGDNKTLRELAGLGAVLGAGAAGMAFMPNNTVHAAEQTAADQNSAVVGSVSANKIQNEGSVAQEQNNSKTQLDKTVNSEDKESSSTTSDVKSESTDSVLSSENKSTHKSKLTDSVSSVNDNSKSIASTSSVSNNSKSIASISSVNSNSNNNSASAVSTRLSNISDSIISNNSNKSLSSLKANNENLSSLSYRTLKNFDLKALLTEAIATKPVESQTMKTHDQDVSNKLTNVDTTLSYFTYNDQSQTNEIKSGQTPTIHPEMSEGLHTNISFTVPKDVGAGDFFDISWSDNMNLYGTHDPNDSSYDTGIQITDPEGKVIAKEDKSNSSITENKARLVFTDYVNTHNNVSGNINFNLFIDPKNVPNDSTETLKVGIGNQQISRKVDVQYTAIKRGTVSISNRYYYDLANGEAFITKTNFTDHKVTSVVYVNPLGYDLRNGVSVDIQNLEDSDINFMPGQGGGKGPLQYKVYRINDDAEPNQSFYIDPSPSQVTDVTDSTSWNSDNQSLTINMPTDEPSNSRYIITYTTTYNSNTQTQQGKYEVPLKTRTTISTTTNYGADNSFYWDNLNTYHPGSESGSGTPAQSASASASRASYSASESASQASHSASESASQASHSASESASQASHSASVSASQASHSASVSASRASHSASVSSSQSNSESVSSSQSNSESVSASQSNSESVSASQSNSESVSASQSNSESVSSSQSNSESVSASQSSSESVSSSQSSSESVSSSQSNSESVSSSQSGSESVSSSQSNSESVSSSQSNSESVSSSQSNSESVSASQSGSESVSSSQSGSESVSASQSGSESVSASRASHSASVSASQSSSESVSSSQSSSESVSASQSNSESVSASQSNSESVSASQSGSESVSASQSGSESVSASQSSSESVSSSQSNSESVSASQSGSESVSASQSGSESVSASQSNSESVSASQSGSESVSASQSNSESVSASQKIGRASCRERV